MSSPEPIRRGQRLDLNPFERIIVMETTGLFSDTNHQSQVIGERVAQKLSGVSDRVRDSSDHIANRLDEAAGYLRGRSARDFASDLGGVVRRNPWQALLGVGALLLAYRLIRR